MNSEPLECMMCGSTKDVEHYRQNTKYVDEDLNWVNYCPKCRKINDQYWYDMWSEYYSGCI